MTVVIVMVVSVAVVEIVFVSVVMAVIRMLVMRRAVRVSAVIAGFGIRTDCQAGGQSESERQEKSGCSIHCLDPRKSVSEVVQHTPQREIVSRVTDFPKKTEILQKTAFSMH